MDLGIKLSSIERSRHRRVLAFNLLQLILRPYRNADQSHEKTTTQKNRIRPIGTKPQLLLAASLLLLGVCTMGTQYIPPTAQQLAVAGYGAPLTIDYKKAIEVLFFDKLKDPLSAQYVLAARPEPWRTIDYIGGTLHIGYAIRFQLNSKNSYGGYIGFRKWLALFRDNQIVAVTYDGNPWSQQFYTGSVSKGFTYGNYQQDEATRQFHQSYHGTDFPWPD